MTNLFVIFLSYVFTALDNLLTSQCIERACWQSAEYCMAIHLTTLNLIFELLSWKLTHWLLLPCWTFP